MTALAAPGPGADDHLIDQLQSFSLNILDPVLMHFDLRFKQVLLLDEALQGTDEK